MEKDLKHLRWLAYGYYFALFLGSLIFLFPLLWVFIGHLSVYLDALTLVLSTYSDGVPDIQQIFSHEKDRAHPIFMIIVMIFGFFIGIPILIGNFCNYYCAKSLKLQKNYTFCLVMSGLALASFPFGTVLGIFSFIVLMRDSVKKLFEDNL
jgi:ABC-type glycerol-3-phosphate transport system permease component